MNKLTIILLTSLVTFVQIVNALPMHEAAVQRNTIKDNAPESTDNARNALNKYLKKVQESKKGNDDGKTGNDDGKTGNDDGKTGNDYGKTGNDDGKTGNDHDEKTYGEGKVETQDSVHNVLLKILKHDFDVEITDSEKQQLKEVFGDAELV